MFHSIGQNQYRHVKSENPIQNIKFWNWKKNTCITHIWANKNDGNWPEIYCLLNVKWKYGSRLVGNFKFYFNNFSYRIKEEEWLFCCKHVVPFFFVCKKQKKIIILFFRIVEWRIRSKSNEHPVNITVPIHQHKWWFIITIIKSPTTICEKIIADRIVKFFPPTFLFSMQIFFSFFFVLFA